MTTAVALLRPPVSERQAVKTRGSCLPETTEGGREGGKEGEKARSHEENRPGGFSLGKSSVNGDQADWDKYEMDTWEGKASIS